MAWPNSWTTIVARRPSQTAKVKGMKSFTPGIASTFLSSFAAVRGGRWTTICWTEKKSMMVMRADTITTIATPSVPYIRRKVL
jgi:hypothetical protein